MKKVFGFGICLILIVAGGWLLMQKGKTVMGPVEQVQSVGELVASNQTFPSAVSISAQRPPVLATNVSLTVFQRLMANDPEVLKVSREQVEAYLERNKTNAESLITAFNMTKDKEYLRMAARSFSNNPAVILATLTRDVFPEERRARLDQLKNAAPDNPLADYMSARDYLANQQPDLAFKELAGAAVKGGYNDFGQEQLQGLEEMYLDSGRSPAEAKALAATAMVYPHLKEMRDLGKDLAGFENQYNAGGDSASAQAVVRMGLNLAANMEAPNGANSKLSQMVGINMEERFLNGLDPNASYDFLQQPVKERLGALQQQETSLREEGSFFDNWMREASEPDLVSYYDRVKMFGEEAAVAWARNRSAGGLSVQ